MFAAWLTCLGLAFLGGAVPWMHAEWLALSLPAIARSNTELVLLVIISTAGHMAGKCLVYSAGRRLVTAPIHDVSRTNSTPDGLLARAQGHASALWQRFGRAAETAAARQLVDRWRARAAARPAAPIALLSISAVFGVPPFYLMSAVAGAVQLNFSAFLIAGTCGRLVRFGVLAFLPQAVARGGFIPG